MASCAPWSTSVGASTSGELVGEVVAGEALPHGLLHARDDAERRELARARGIGEVAGDAELEDALRVRGGVALAQPGRRDRCALLRDPWCALARASSSLNCARKAAVAGAGQMSTMRTGAGAGALAVSTIPSSRKPPAAAIEYSSASSPPHE